MDLIDNGNLNIDNIACKIQMLIELIEQLKKERGDDFTNEKKKWNNKRNPKNST